MKRVLLALAALVAVAALTATSAFAGEAQGNFGTTGNYTPIENYVANSICAFSGQNPEQFATGDDFEPGRTQSWGQDVRAGQKAFLTSIGLAPGQSCNGHTGLLTQGGE